MIDLRSECERILLAAREQHVMLRVIGGMAVHLHSPISTGLPPLRREYGDLDFVTVSPDDQGMRRFFESVNFMPNARFNALQGATRMIFDSADGGWYIDVFINKFHMCHDITFTRERLEHDPVTVPLAELLLTKLQIVTINLKDIKDVVALLLDHPVGPSDDETINISRIVELTSRDWGLYTTVRMNLNRIPEHLRTIELPESSRRKVRAAIDEIDNEIEISPKTRAWKMRSLIGKALPWYEEPEDATRGNLRLE